MEHNEEYHDPDYPETLTNIKEEAPILSEEEKIVKIKQIIHREFKNELNIRENEVTLIDQRMTTARRYLHQVRYSLVNNYYRDQKLQLSGSQIEDEVAAQTEPRARSEVSSILRESQRRLHPSVRKLVGKQTVDLEEIFRSREPRNKARKDYSAMVQTKNITISADSTISLRPSIEKMEEEEPCSSRPKKIPRQIDPKVNNVVTFDEITRNKKKHRYRIIIGNTSKYAPPASRADRSTHKWLLYVRGPPARADVSRVLRAVSVQLHHSYAPHHTVHIDKPPFQVSRRGWGEFPARVTLHFALPDRNRPATLTHTIKLDRHYTGLQTLGAETVADVWLYSTQEMLEFEYKADEEQMTLKPAEEIKQEEPPEAKCDPSETKVEQNDSWLDFFSKDTTEVNVDEMFVKNIKTEPEDNQSNEINETEHITEVNDDKHITANGDHDQVSNIHVKLEDPPTENNKPKKRIMKYMDPSTRKIYYLEMDRNLDLSKVQEIIINSQGDTQTAKISPIKTNGLKHVRNKKPVSLLKPEIKNLLKRDVESEKIQRRNELNHIENDHCYLATNWRAFDKKCNVTDEMNGVSLCDNLKTVIKKFTCTRVIVSYLLKNIPLISEEARNPDFVQCLPFVVENDEKYWKLDFAKRRNMEWSRAKLINKMLAERFKTDPSSVWRTKQILVYSRLHGYYPVLSENIQKEPDMETNEWSSWNDLENTRQIESNIRKLYPNASDISSLTLFDSEKYVDCNSSETLDLCDSDEEIDVVNIDAPVKVENVKTETEVALKTLPVDKDEKLMFYYIEKICADIGIELRNENIGSGYSYSAVHKVLLTAMKCFAEELIRSSLADQLSLSNDPQLPTIWTGSRARPALRPPHVYRAARAAPRARPLAAHALGAERRHAHAL
ncbi:uncharacterized protein LOC126779038 [Nymphalis io]|uniref:uncharacterized protein LOC126779038 n=1 Tax=Inachis io TaxID=171585 RepID=UPI002169473A|nr:uncharacterized protein LOC126779038 [Nymphalis io]